MNCMQIKYMHIYISLEYCVEYLYKFVLPNTEEESKRPGRPKKA